MKLTAKLMVVFMLGIIALTTLNAYVTLQRERELFIQETSDLARGTGAMMEPVVRSVWQTQGEEVAQRIVKKISPAVLSVRWVRFLPRAGEKDRPLVPLGTTPVAPGQTHLWKPRDGVEMVVMYHPINVAGSPPGGLEFSRSMESLEKRQRQLLQLTLLLTIGMVLLTGGIMAWTGAAFVARPLNLLIEKTRRIAKGDFSGPLHLKTQDELQELSDSVNDMCEKLSAAQRRVEDEMAARVAAVEQLRHADRLKTVGRLASGVAHELGTPLNVIAGRAGMIASGKLSPAEAADNADIIRGQSQQMTQIIRQLLDFSRQNSPRRVGVDLRNVISQTVELLTPLAEKRRVSLEIKEPSESLVGQVDAGQIQQVLSNLIINATEAMPSGGVVQVGAHQRPLTRSERLARGNDPTCGDQDEALFLVITVRDEGSGIAPEHLNHVFEPFFTTKDVGEGTGLGLSISYAILQEHGGWISVESEIARGSTFSVFLPAEADLSRSPAPRTVMENVE